VENNAQEEKRKKQAAAVGFVQAIFFNVTSYGTLALLVSVDSFKSDIV